jgi:hypothetical protein
MAARAAAKKVAKKTASGGLSRTEGAALAAPVVATGIGGVAAERRRREDAKERDKAAEPRTRAENLQSMHERADKLQRDVSTRHYKGMANSTKQK